MRISDWSSDVCSSDLYERHLAAGLHRIGAHPLDATGTESLAPLLTQLFPESTPNPPQTPHPASEPETAPQQALLPPAGEGARRADECALDLDLDPSSPPTNTNSQQHPDTNHTHPHLLDHQSKHNNSHPQ